VNIGLLASAVFGLAVFLLILRAVRQRGLLEQLAPGQRCPDEELSTVALIVPARNEEANIGALLTSLARQDYPANRFKILVVDDGSTDSTGSIIAGLAECFPAISVLRGMPLEPGWTGKCQACWQAAKAVDSAPEYLCFIDADMRADPLLLRSTVRAAMSKDIALLSLAPRHQLVTFAERLILPCGHYLLGFRQDLARRQAPNSGLVTISGQFMLFRRSVYEQVGGHAAVRGMISEDVALARLVKNAGHKVLLMGGKSLLSTRMYQGWKSLWEGIGKNLIDMLDGPASTVSTVLAAAVLAWAAYLLPVVDAGACQAGSAADCVGLAIAVPASLAAIGLHLAGAYYFRIPLWYGLLFPLAYTAGAWMAFESVLRRLTGRIRWKDRIYP
jgi:chlorobactene glucosyltransferase